MAREIVIIFSSTCTQWWANPKKKMDNKVIIEIDDLLERLKHLREMEERKEVERLKTERSLLLQNIALCDKALDKIANLALKTAKILVLLQTITDATGEKQAAADEKWLAYWGIHKGGQKKKRIIYEMQQLDKKQARFLEN